MRFTGCGDDEVHLKLTGRYRKDRIAAVEVHDVQQGLGGDIFWSYFDTLFGKEERHCFSVVGEDGPGVGTKSIQLAPLCVEGY